MYRLKEIGRIKTKSASEVAKSRLGIGFEKLDRDAFNPENAYDKISKIGVKWVRIQSGWQKTEKEKGVYDFAWLDSIVDNILARDMIPWMCVCYGNKIYGGMAEEVFGAVGCPPIHTEEQKSAWNNYCRTLAKHYRGRVDHFEVWNEPDGLHCWKHGTCAEEVGEFNIATAKALKEGNPDCYIVGGALGAINMSFERKLFKTGMLEHVDAISFHAYIFDDTRLKGNIRALRAAVDMYNPKIEIIQGESGAQSRPYGHGALRTGAWTERKQCKFMLRHLVTDLGMGCKFASYFSALDMMEALKGKVGDAGSYKDYGYFGVLGAEFDENGVAVGKYSEKPSYYALSNLSSLLSGETTAIDLPVTVYLDMAPHCGNAPTLKEGGVEMYGFRLDNGALALAYWHPSDYMTTDYEGAVSFQSAIDGNPRLLDPMDGKIYELCEDMLTKDEWGNDLLKLLPIKDYPMFLIFGDCEL